MKVTKNQLKQLISEEIKNVLSEDRYKLAGGEDPDYGYGDYFKPKTAQEKTPVPAVSTDKAVDDQDEAKKAADKIRDLATELETELNKKAELETGLKEKEFKDLAEKAAAIIGFVNTRL